MRKKKDVHTDEEKEEDGQIIHEGQLLWKVQSPLNRDNVADLMKVFHRLGAHKYQLDYGYIEPSFLGSVCHRNSVNCLKALFKGMMGFKVDPNARLKDGVTPLHLAASNLCYDMIRLLLSHGAYADLRTLGPIVPGGLLPLNIAVHHARLHKYLECWTEKDSVYKLIILISLPEMKPFLDVVRLLAEHTNCSLDELLRYIKHGKFVHMAILIAAAWRKILRTPIPDADGGGSAMDVISGCIDKMVLSANEQERGLGRVHKNSKYVRPLNERKNVLALMSQERALRHVHTNSKYVRPLNERKNVLALMSSFLNVYKKIGNKLDRYVRSVNSKVSRNEVVEQVTSLLKQQGFAVKNDAAALSNLQWYCYDSTRKLFESVGIKLECTRSTDFPLDQIYKIRKVRILTVSGYNEVPSKRAVDDLLIESFHGRWNKVISPVYRDHICWGPRYITNIVIINSFEICESKYLNSISKEKKQCCLYLLGYLNMRRGYCTAASMVSKVLRRI